MRTFIRNFVNATTAFAQTHDIEKTELTMDDVTNITGIFEDLLHQTGSVDMAEAEFKRMVADDPELRTLYRRWCADRGCTERRGFADYCEEWLDTQASIWENLKDTDDDEP